MFRFMGLFGLFNGDVETYLDVFLEIPKAIIKRHVSCQMEGNDGKKRATYLHLV